MFQAGGWSGEIPSAGDTLSTGDALSARAPSTGSSRTASSVEKVPSLSLAFWNQASRLTSILADQAARRWASHCRQASLSAGSGVSASIDSVRIVAQEREKSPGGHPVGQRGNPATRIHRKGILVLFGMLGVLGEREDAEVESHSIAVPAPPGCPC